MKRQLLKPIALLLAAAMVALLGACQPKQTTSSGSSSAALSSASSAEAAFTPFDPPVTLELNMGSTGIAIKNGVQTDPVMKEIEKRLGIIIKLDSSMNSELEAAKIASGDMGDYMQLYSTGEPVRSQALRLAASKQLLDLNPLMQKYGPNLKNLEKQVAFWRTQYGTGNDSFYLACGGVGPYDKAAGTGGIGVVLRYDYYEELGSPPIKSLDDWVSVVDQMVKKHPTTADGQKRYGFTFFNEWGWATMPGHIAVVSAALEGKAYNMDYGETGYYPDEGRVENPYLTPDSPFWKALRLYNKAYQLGILDPDYMTNKWDNIIEKSTADRIMSSIWTWAYLQGINAKLALQGTGYALVPLDFKSMPISPSMPMGADYINHVIPVSCKNPEAAMRLMDFLYSEEGAMLINNGVEGKDYVLKDGKYTRTQSSIDAQKKSANWPIESGRMYGNYSGLGTGYTLSKTGQQLSSVNPGNIDDLDPFQKKICEKYGITNPALVFKDGNLSMDTTFTSFLNPMPDDMMVKWTEIKAWMGVDGPKLISAKTDAEFEAGKLAFIAKLKTAGMEDIAKWLDSNFLKALTEENKYK